MTKAVALALGYIDGRQISGSPGHEVEAQAFLEYLAGQGFDALAQARIE